MVMKEVVMKVNLYDMVVDNDRIPYLKGSGRVSAGKNIYKTKSNSKAVEKVL